MAIGNAADIGYGSSITFQSGLLAQITNIDHDPLAERNAIDISHMTVTNGWRIFRLGDLKDPGQVTVEINFLTNDLTDYKTAIAAAEETVTITTPILADGGLTAGTWACKGGLIAISAAVPMDDKMTATVVIKLSGEPTATNAT